jgi:hypothetical protein
MRAIESSTEASGGSPKRRRFRWRTVPVALLGAFGGLSLFGGAFSFFVMAYAIWTDRSLYPPALVMGLWGVGCGGLLLTASRLWWVGRWRLALIVVGVCIVAAQVLMSTGMLPE